MTDTRPTLYVSCLLPDPVMAIIRNRFQLVQDPHDTLPTAPVLREGLCQADAGIVTLGDRIDAETIQAATRLKILANYAVGYNNIDLAAAKRRGLIVTNTPDVLTDATADLTWALLLATARRIVEGDGLVRSGHWTGWSPTQLLGAEISGKTLGIIGIYGWWQDDVGWDAATPTAAHDSPSPTHAATAADTEYVSIWAAATSTRPDSLGTLLRKYHGYETRTLPPDDATA